LTFDNVLVDVFIHILLRMLQNGYFPV